MYNFLIKFKILHNYGNIIFETSKENESLVFDLKTWNEMKTFLVYLSLIIKSQDKSFMWTSLEQANKSLLKDIVNGLKLIGFIHLTYLLIDSDLIKI